MSFQQIVRIPRDRIGVIIGKNGKIKVEIQEKCKVMIEIDSESGDAVIFFRIQRTIYRNGTIQGSGDSHGYFERVFTSSGI